MVANNDGSLIPPQKSLSASPPEKRVDPTKPTYGTIQISSRVKEQIVDWCNRNDLKIGKFIERIFLNEVSGSKK